MEKVPLVGSLFHKTTERLLQLWVVCTLGMLDQVSMLKNIFFLRRRQNLPKKLPYRLDL
jgi:hypothetical protein